MSSAPTTPISASLAPASAPHAGVQSSAATGSRVQARDARPARTARVWCVIPWHARAGELRALLGDLGLLAFEGESRRGALSLEVRALIVDNASSEQFSLPDPATLPSNLRIDRLRLDENRGGSGGFNAGMERVLEECGDDEDAYVWLLDSDARVARGALIELVKALDENPRIGAAGSALADPETGRVFEVGGIVDRRTSALRPARAGGAGAGPIVECDYAASCSALVRVDAIRTAGLMPDLFLHADDAAWMVRLARITGKRVVGVASSVVYHPRFDRFALRGRYYAARNAFAPLGALGLGRGPVLRRAFREVKRAAQQELLGRSDLARLHVLGLRDAAAGVSGAGAGLSPAIDPFKPLAELGSELKSLLAGAGSWKVSVASEHELELTDAEYQTVCAELGRAGLHVVSEGERGRPWRVVPARVKGWGLLRAAGLIMIVRGSRGGGTEPGFAVRTGDPLTIAWRACRTGIAATYRALLVAAAWRRAPLVSPAPLAPAPSPARRGSGGASPATLTLSVVVVSYNRWDALRGTLARLRAMPEVRDAEVVVVDNASSDGSPAKVEKEFPGVRVIALDTNTGVAAFNRGVDAATGDVVLVLDDDSWPEPGAVEAGLRTLAENPRLGAVVLHPRHPENGRSEWRYAHFGEGGRDDWPVMGCGNLVRRDVWNEVGGYEENFFLYRNDADLALKLLGAGWGVYFDPARTVWHNSPAAARKSPRWHRVATRNWIWLARRHGRGVGVGGGLGALLGWLWAHRLAGLSPGRQWATLRGVIEGIFKSPPRVSIRSNAGGHFGRLVRLSMGRADR